MLYKTKHFVKWLIMDKIKNKELITIGRFDRLIDAYSVASRIESEGIECFLPGEMLVKSSHNQRIEPLQIKLQVRREDAARARRILNKKPFDAFGDAPTR